MFWNNIEDIFVINGLDGIDYNLFKIFLILYADKNVIFANANNELQQSLGILYKH